MEKKANIAIVGLTGSGKTTVAALLASRIRYGYVDIDSEVESAQGKSIADIFETDGEQKFRLEESAQIRKVSSASNFVISVGGGSILNDENWETLQSCAHIVWLSTSPEEIAQRLYMSPAELGKRPKLSKFTRIEDNLERKSQIVSLLGQIEKEYYFRLSKADLQVNDSHSPPETTMQFLFQKLSMLDLIN